MVVLAIILVPRGCDDDNVDDDGDYNLCTGNDVYFECDVRANPIPHKLIWLHNVSLNWSFEEQIALC